MTIEVKDFGLSATGGVNATTGFFPEGQLPSTVNDGMRTVMAATRRVIGDISGEYTATFTAQVYTLPTNQEVTALARGHCFTWIAEAANTGTATLVVSGLSGVPLKVGASHLLPGQIETGQAVSAIFDGADFQMLSVAKPGIERIGEYTASAAATFDIESGINATRYVGYMLDIVYMYPATDGTTLGMQVKSAGAYQAAGYATVTSVIQSTNGTAFLSDNTVTGSWRLGTASSASSTIAEAWSGKIHFTNPHDTTAYLVATGHGSYVGAGGGFNTAYIGGYYGTGGGLQGIRFLASSGNINGRVVLYGLRA